MMNSTRPYLIRAFYEWIVDNDCTPQIVVNTDFPGVDVPMEYAESGQIVLNISMMAVQSLELGDQAVQFKARFSSVAREVYVPVLAVMAIYARENGRGMVFADDEDEPPPPPEKEDDDKEGKDKGGKGKDKSSQTERSHLKVIK